MWRIVREYDLEQKLNLLGRNIALQGELIGGKIQSNPYKMNNYDDRIFKIWDIDNHNYLHIDGMIELSATLGLTTVPVLEKGFQLPETMDEALFFADDVSTLYSTNREGVVLYAEEDPDIHFKMISNTFLEKEK
ncbi:MAG: ATP-dependent RNA circularization protein (DNA/RNA ligase family) [Granulosicoccus sp.]|jgi:ATP-dependent RNA circularization protein (DNA/RNA ligase family)